MSKNLAPTICGRTMHTIENGNERTKYAPAIAFAITKNLHQNYKRLSCMIRSTSSEITKIPLGLRESREVVVVCLELEELGEKRELLAGGAHSGSSR